MGGAIGHTDQHESPAPEIPGLGMDDGQSESGCDRGIYGVATCLHHLDSSARSQFVHAGHHGMGSMHGAHGRCARDHAEHADHHEASKLFALKSHEIGLSKTGRFAGFNCILGEC
jgi:hypothetical protein